MASFVSKNASVLFAAVGLMLIILFMYAGFNSVLGNGDDGVDDSAQTSTSITASTVLGSGIPSGSGEEVVEATCQLPASDSEPIRVVAYNGGSRTVDYQVEAELGDSEGNFVRSVATFNRLRSDETRFIVPVWSGELSSIRSCEILALETDRAVVQKAGE